MEKELGVQGMKDFKSKIRVGDLVCNHWASERNPNRVGIFIGYKVQNGTKCIVLTDEKATRKWYPIFDSKSKLEILDSIFNNL